jgi:hypothetical protein
MMWHLVLPAWVEMLKADPELSAELGGPHIYPAQSARPVRVPSVEYTLPIIDREEENFNSSPSRWTTGREARRRPPP